MVFELVAEMPERGEHRIRRGLSQPTQRAITDVAAQFVQDFKMMRSSCPFRDATQDAHAFIQSCAARNAFSAGLGVGEFDEVAGDINHAVVFVYQDHAAVAHDGTELRQIFVVHRGIEHVLRNAAAGRAARLNGLHLTTSDCAFTDVVDERLQRRTEWHFHQTGVFHFANKREDFSPRALRTPGLGKPRRATRHNGSDVVPGFDVVDVGRLPPQTFLRWERRTRTRPAGFAFQRGNQRGFLSTDEGTGAFDQLDVELESAAKNVFPKQAIFSCLLDRAIQTMNRERILGAHVDDSFGCAHDVPANDHSFQKRVRVAFNLVAIHVSAGVAFIGIADDVLGLGFRLGEELPLVAGKISGAATAAQLRGLDLLDHGSRVGVDQNFIELLISTDCDVFLNVVRVDDAAVPQNDLLLTFEEGNVVPRGHLGISLAVSDVARDVIPFLNFAADEIGSEIALGDVVEQSSRVVRLHLPQHDERIAGQPDAHQRLLEAGSKATDGCEDQVVAAGLDRLCEGMVETLGSVAAAAGSHSYGNAGNSGNELGHPRLPHCVEGAKIQNSRHATLPLGWFRFRAGRYAPWRARRCDDSLRPPEPWHTDRSRRRYAR